MTQWHAVKDDGQPPQVVPLNDLREHEYSENCWCEPYWDGGIVVHNALDRRELYERGELKPS